MKELSNFYRGIENLGRKVKFNDLKISLIGRDEKGSNGDRHYPHVYRSYRSFRLL